MRTIKRRIRMMTNVGRLSVVLVLAASLASLFDKNETGAHAQSPVRGQDAGSQSAQATEPAIRKLLDAQIKAWNAGDVEGFMEYYWKSDDLTFSSGGKTTRSWKATLERYKQRYPTKAAMGTTTFKNLEVTPLGDGAAMVLGEWQLKRENGETIGGNFSLVLRKLDGKWVIIHDHTSQLPPP